MSDPRDYGVPTGVVPRRTQPLKGIDGAWDQDAKPAPAQDPLKVQVQGTHYKNLKIQPIEYIHANAIPFAEGCVIKYVTRWRDKGGIKDLEKARHFLDLLIQLESKK